PGQQADQQLCAAHGEGWHENLPTFLHGILHNANELIDRFHEWPVVMVAVGGFEKHQVGMPERLEFFQNERASWSEVSGEHHSFLTSFLLDNQLEAGGAEHVAGLRPHSLD